MANPFARFSFSNSSFRPPQRQRHLPLGVSRTAEFLDGISKVPYGATAGAIPIAGTPERTSISEYRHDRSRLQGSQGDIASPVSLTGGIAIRYNREADFPLHSPPGYGVSWHAERFDFEDKPTG